MKKFNREDYLSFQRYDVYIDNVWYTAVVLTWYNGPLDLYIPYEDIYLRSIDADRTLWAMFKDKGELGELSWKELFNTYKMWTPMDMSDSWNCLTTI